MTKHHRPSGLNNRNLLPQLWGCKSKAKVPPGLVSSEGYWEKICPGPLSWLLVACWTYLVLLALQMQHPLLSWCPPCVCVSVPTPPFPKAPVIVNEDPLWWPHVNLISPLQKSYLQIRSHSEILLGLGLQHTYLGGDTLQPSSSAGKESTCNSGDPGSILGSGRSAGEGIGYSLQYSWASLVVKNPPAIWETWARSLGWEDPLEK